MWEEDIPKIYKNWKKMIQYTILYTPMAQQAWMLSSSEWEAIIKNPTSLHLNFDFNFDFDYKVSGILEAWNLCYVFAWLGSAFPVKRRVLRR